MARLLVEQNPPCPVFFAGWASDTFTLGRQGWQIAYEQDHYRDDRTLLLYHKALGLKAIAHARGNHPFHRFDGLASSQNLYPKFVVTRLASEIFVRYEAVNMPFQSMKWVDTVPTMIPIEEHELMSLPLFRQLDAPVAEKLIVEPADVATLLDQIRNMQSSEQAAIRARNRSREALNDGHKPLIHATLMSFNKAA